MRNRYSLIGLIVFLALGLGIATAQTSGTSSQSPNPPQGSPNAGTQGDTSVGEHIGRPPGRELLISPARSKTNSS